MLVFCFIIEGKGGLEVPIEDPAGAQPLRTWQRLLVEVFAGIGGGMRGGSRLMGRMGG